MFNITGVFTLPENILNGVFTDLLCLLQQRTIRLRNQPLKDTATDEGLPTQSVCDHISIARYVLNSKAIGGQLRHPPLLACVKLWLRHDVC